MAQETEVRKKVDEMGKATRKRALYEATLVAFGELIATREIGPDIDPDEIAEEAIACAESLVRKMVLRRII